MPSAPRTLRACSPLACRQRLGAYSVDGERFRTSGPQDLRTVPPATNLLKSPARSSTPTGSVQPVTLRDWVTKSPNCSSIRQRVAAVGSGGLIVVLDELESGDGEYSNANAHHRDGESGANWDAQFEGISSFAVLANRGSIEICSLVVPNPDGFAPVSGHGLLRRPRLPRGGPQSWADAKEICPCAARRNAHW